MSARPALSTYRTAVRPEWIDYNGHMSEAFYVLVFGYATDEAMDVLGLGPRYRERTGCSLYTVEAHIRYLQEVPLGAPLTVHTEVVGVAGKKLHLAHSMSAALAGAEPALVSTEEILGVHVDQNAGGAVPLPDEVLTAARGAQTPAPAWSGRAVGV
ncbi:thioesterase family protein [Tomitella gaofuii]|uniref:thioesterase family protein n=1 Tax=Tomitella gaofuii TaxID=2760083 RepID=UPI001C70BE2F|nr:thioesterase family protein [Tomitella gaofuii]